MRIPQGAHQPLYAEKGDTMDRRERALMLLRAALAYVESTDASELAEDYMDAHENDTPDGERLDGVFFDGVQVGMDNGEVGTVTVDWVAGT